MTITHCPYCNANLQGGLIFDTGMEKFGCEDEALLYAKGYGATKTDGYWRREFAIYSLGKDMTVAYQCPECNREWERT